MIVQWKRMLARLLLCTTLIFPFVDAYVVFRRDCSIQIPFVSSSALNSVSKPQTRDFDPFVHAMNELGYTPTQQDLILSELSRAGLWIDDKSSTLCILTKGFPKDNCSAISTFLIEDFAIKPLVAHQTRAALLSLQHGYDRPDSIERNVLTEQKQLYKSVVLDKSAKVRTSMAYGLPRNYEVRYPIIGQEMHDFLQFITVASTDSQGERPIRVATAKTYICHAKLFLGWYVQYHRTGAKIEEAKLSLYHIFPTKEKENANSILEFLSWLRSTRKISVSYEANLLRGLGKLVKFRFRKESSEGGSGKSFDDIPVLREIRKLHRDANRQQQIAPRVSDETRKWLSWPEYLNVVENARKDTRKMILSFDSKFGVPLATPATIKNKTRKDVQKRAIATLFQKYLVLAFFANVPDRQRTIRELEIGRSFVKCDDKWTIKHSPDDYKTGNTYGDRPPLLLPQSMTSEIDEFIERWRPSLLRDKLSSHLFLQVRTGNALTQDSVYQIVARTCFFYTGKRTNPHLLRDMIVTHVRESSDASERQLEALALLMGHSVDVQRKSYDRRTMTKKVAPAVALIEQVNADSMSSL